MSTKKATTKTTVEKAAVKKTTAKKAPAKKVAANKSIDKETLLKIDEQLQKYYNVSLADASDKQIYSALAHLVNDKTLESADFLNISYKIANNSEAEVILVDLNDGPESICTEVIYLIEPGIIKLNKLIRHDYKIFDKLRGKKIVLNKSVLDNSEVRDTKVEVKYFLTFHV